MIKTLEFVHHGGPFMYVILLCLVAGLAIIIERGIALRRKNLIPLEIIDAADSVRSLDDVPTLKKICEADNSSLSIILQTAINHLSWPKHETLEAVQTKARYQINLLERGLVVLEICVGIGPLLGLLGTVAGLMKIFEGLGAQTSEMQTIIVARGIAEALNNTVAGLAVAIPALIAWSYFSRKIESSAVVMESVSSDFLSKVYRG